MLPQAVNLLSQAVNLLPHAVNLSQTIFNSSHRWLTCFQRQFICSNREFTCCFPASSGALLVFYRQFNASSSSLGTCSHTHIQFTVLGRLKDWLNIIRKFYLSICIFMASIVFIFILFQPWNRLRTELRGGSICCLSCRAGTPKSMKIYILKANLSFNPSSST